MSYLMNYSSIIIQFFKFHYEDHFFWFQLIPCLLVMVSGRPDAGYSYSPPSRYLNNNIRPSSQYGVPKLGGIFPNNLQSGNVGFGGFSFKPPLTGNTRGFALGGFGFKPPLTGNTGDKSNQIIDSQIAIPGIGRTGRPLTGATKFSIDVGNFRPSIPVVKKTVYLYESPQELEAPITSNVVIPQSRPKINYKIVFIKTPAAPTPTAPVIPQFAQDQEKTLIYVLVKRPEEAPEITIPTLAPTAPSKPEVYFIKYKTQKETKTIGGVQQKPVYGPPGHHGSY